MKQGVSFILNLLSYISEMTFRLPPHQMYQWNFKFSYSGIRACVYILLNILACTIYVVRFFATPRTVACYAALGAISYSRGSSWPRDWTVFMYLVICPIISYQVILFCLLYFRGYLRKQGETYRSSRLLRSLGVILGYE